MNTEEFHNRLNELYLPPENRFSRIDVPQIDFLCIDGNGDPQGEEYAQAVKWLFTMAYLVKPIIKARLGKNFVEPPLEALYWADDQQDFIDRKVEKLRWRTMIVFIKDWVPADDFDRATAKAEK